MVFLRGQQGRLAVEVIHGRPRNCSIDIGELRMDGVVRDVVGEEER